MTEEEVMDLIKAALERLTPARLSEVIEAVEAKRRDREAEAKENASCRIPGACDADGAVI
jgi:hypothetical protein